MIKNKLFLGEICKNLIFKLMINNWVWFLFGVLASWIAFYGFLVCVIKNLSFNPLIWNHDMLLLYIISCSIHNLFWTIYHFFKLK